MTATCEANKLLPLGTPKGLMNVTCETKDYVLFEFFLEVLSLSLETRKGSREQPFKAKILIVRSTLNFITFFFGKSNYMG